MVGLSRERVEGFFLEQNHVCCNASVDIERIIVVDVRPNEYGAIFFHVLMFLGFSQYLKTHRANFEW